MNTSISENDLYDVIKTLIGTISPVGETSVDKMRCDHLSSHYEITEMLIEDIGKVASRYCHRNEYSMNKAGKRAKKYLEQIYEQAAFWLKEIQSQEGGPDEP